MLKKILVINSAPDKNTLLLRTFKELSRRDFLFNLWSQEFTLLNEFKKNSWPASRVFIGPELVDLGRISLFFLILPLLQLKFFFALASLKIKHRLDLIICLDFKEKIIVSLPAVLLGVKIVWLEGPELNYRKINRLIFWLYRLNGRLARLIVFTNYAKTQLTALGFKENKIKLISPGSKVPQYQENIFNKLAAANQAGFHKKYFTIGAITGLNQKQKIEMIFQAVKTCLPVIANLQLIIVGEGEERKNLSWLAKKMEIENLVWLVGEQEQLKKWLDSFDIFLVPGDSLKLNDYGNILEAMAVGLPILAPRNLGLEDLVLENKTGSFFEAGNNEMLSRQIIKLHQDKKLRAYLGKNGQEQVDRFFTLDKMVAEIADILRN